jgi:hypothetical protein
MRLRISQPLEFTYLYKSPQRASVSAISAGDVNLWRIFFMFRIFVAATTAVVATIFARTFPVCVCGFITLIFGRRLWRRDALSLLLLFD